MTRTGPQTWPRKSIIAQGYLTYFSLSKVSQTHWPLMHLQASKLHIGSSFRFVSFNAMQVGLNHARVSRAKWTMGQPCCIVTMGQPCCIVTMHRDGELTLHRLVSLQKLFISQFSATRNFCISRLPSWQSYLVLPAEKGDFSFQIWIRKQLFQQGNRLYLVLCTIRKCDERWEKTAPTGLQTLWLWKIFICFTLDTFWPHMKVGDTRFYCSAGNCYDASSKPV